MNKILTTTNGEILNLPKKLAVEKKAFKFPFFIVWKRKAEVVRKNNAAVTKRTLKGFIESQIFEFIRTEVTPRIFIRVGWTM